MLTNTHVGCSIHAVQVAGDAADQTATKSVLGEYRGRLARDFEDVRGGKHGGESESVQDPRYRLMLQSS